MTEEIGNHYLDDLSGWTAAIAVVPGVEEVTSTWHDTSVHVCRIRPDFVSTAISLVAVPSLVNTKRGTGEPGDPLRDDIVTTM